MKYYKLITYILLIMKNINKVHLSTKIKYNSIKLLQKYNILYVNCRNS